jgi:beta-galactosidase
MKRDRNHPSVTIWSTGNEIPERGGLGNGYTLANRIAEKAHSLDPSRPVSNAICSYWSGLDDDECNLNDIDIAIARIVQKKLCKE